MYKINLIPQAGILIEGVGQVYFGESREKLIKSFGNYKSINKNTDKRVEYPDYGFFADFKKEDDSFEAVEFWNNHKRNSSLVFIYGVEVLQTKAQSILELLQQKNNNEIPNDGWFINIDVIYSGADPKSAEAVIEQAKADGLLDGSYKESLFQDLDNAEYFSTFGIGYNGYCKDGLEMLKKILNG